MQRRKLLKSMAAGSLLPDLLRPEESVLTQTKINKNMWNQTKLTKLLGIKYPIVQGPFGGGLSSVELASVVSNMGGLGSFGAQPYTTQEIVATADALRKATSRPFAINLWVSHQTHLVEEYSPQDYQKLKVLFKPYFDEANISMPESIADNSPKYEDQLEGIFKAKPPVFSFVYGIPSPEVILECNRLGIITIGTATTLDEALSIEEAKIDAIVATGMEAGGHRVSFLKSSEDSLTGTFSLIQQVAEKVKIPVIAAGGIADGRGVYAMLQLGADAVQIGTSFLACDESNATEMHKKMLFSERAKYTVLTKSFTGRLARGLESKIATETKPFEHQLAPYPLQSNFLSPLRKALIAQGKEDYLTFWAGQSASLIKHHSAKTLMKDLVETTERLYQ